MMRQAAETLGWEEETSRELQQLKMQLQE
jgi:hypothetical protein